MEKGLLANRGGYLIIGDQLVFRKTLQELFAKWNFSWQNNPNFLHLHEDTVGIAQVRLLKKFFAQKKWGKGAQKVVAIPQADQLSAEAQNALLKLLEELKEGEFIFLGTVSPTSLLPTIVSRCQTLSLHKTTFTAQPLDFATLEKLSPSDRLVWAEKNLKSSHLTSAQLKERLQASLLWQQKKLLETDQLPQLLLFKKRLSCCYRALALLEANLQPFFVVDWLLLSL